MSESTAGVSLGSRVLGASAAITVASLATQVLAFVTTPITTRIFAPEAFGASASVATGASVLLALLLGPIDQGYARFGVSEQANRAEIERFCWQLGLVLSAVAMGIAFVSWRMALALGLRLPPEYSWVLALTIGAGTVSSLSLTRQRLMGRYRRIAFAFAAAGSATALLPIVLGGLWRTDAWPLLLTAATTSIVLATVLGVPGLSFLFRRASLPPGLRRQIVLLGIPSLVTMPSYWAITSSDRWFLVGLAGQDAAGIYSVAFSLGMVGIAVNNALSLAWFPEVVRLASSDAGRAQSEVGRLWSRLVIILAFVWLALAAAGGDVLRLLTPPAFHMAADFIPWIAAGCFFYGVATLASTGLFVSGQVVPVGFAWAVGGALSIAMNAVLIPRFGSAAAATTMAVALASVAGIVLRASQRRWPMRIEVGRLLPVLGGLVVCGIGMARPWHERPIVSMALKILPALVIVLLATARGAPEWLRLARRTAEPKTANGRNEIE